MVITIMMVFILAGCNNDSDTATPSQATPDSVVSPWENGGKQPEDYTWEEFEALSDEQQMAFQNSFEDNKDFENWYYKVGP